MKSLCAALALLIAAADVAGAQTQRRGFAVRITAPADGSIVLGRTRIAAEIEIASPELVERVEFSVDDEVVFVDREAPWECTHDFGEESRPWIVRAVAHHREEVTVEDTVVTRHVPFISRERFNRVVMWITARDRDGALLTDLDKEDLRVTEEGAAQEILEFQQDRRPISVALLLDSSQSMRDRLETVHAAASSFVDALRPEDRALVIDFDDKVFLIQELTDDKEAIKGAVRSTEAIGGTAIYDALHAAYRELRDVEGHRVIVLLSDGDDSASRIRRNRILEEVRGGEILVYTIGLGGGAGGPRKGVLKDLAEASGARAFFAGKAERLAEIYAEIAAELLSQFILAYSTENEVWDGRLVEVKVEAKDPTIRVRSKPGYFAVRGDSPGGGGGTSSGMRSNRPGS